MERSNNSVLLVRHPAPNTQRKDRPVQQAAAKPRTLKVCRSRAVAVGTAASSPARQPSTRSRSQAQADACTWAPGQALCAAAGSGETLCTECTGRCATFPSLSSTHPAGAGRPHWCAGTGRRCCPARPCLHRAGAASSAVQCRRSRLCPPPATPGARHKGRATARCRGSELHSSPPCSAALMHDNPAARGSLRLPQGSASRHGGGQRVGTTRCAIFLQSGRWQKTVGFSFPRRAAGSPVKMSWNTWPRVTTLDPKEGPGRRPPRLPEVKPDE